jgi:SpoVK/Ycf46/Vps4 family AAA+-type ATPase
MFYNGPETEQVGKLSSILRGDSYREVCKRLADKGMRTGFACLFSGSPGTGKTETAFQIARETKRDIMKVDIPHIIGAYVGESEKNIKDQFDHYRSVVKNTKTAPILLFNEADGLISKRMELTPHNPSVERMWNSMQNIILEEMEDLKGILIATTNMTINLDKAFERRFLFKIEFHKPDRPNRLSIWRSMIPELSGPDMETLADRFEFSGGQIENVARKWIMEQALSGSNPPIEKIIAFCKEELLEKESPGNIGFMV